MLFYQLWKLKNLANITLRAIAKKDLESRSSDV